MEKRHIKEYTIIIIIITIIIIKICYDDDDDDDDDDYDYYDQQVLVPGQRFQWSDFSNTQQYRHDQQVCGQVEPTSVHKLNRHNRQVHVPLLPPSVVGLLWSEYPVTTDRYVYQWY